MSNAADEDELASGRLVLPTTRRRPAPGRASGARHLARAELEPELASDPMLGAVGWSWLVDALDARQLGYVAEAGTVTRVVSESFAGLADREPTVEMEVRVVDPRGEIGGHLLAWSDLLCTIAGLPPLPEGVVALPAASATSGLGRPRGRGHARGSRCGTRTAADATAGSA